MGAYDDQSCKKRPVSTHISDYPRNSIETTLFKKKKTKKSKILSSFCIDWIKKIKIDIPFIPNPNKIVNKLRLIYSQSKELSAPKCVTKKARARKFFFFVFFSSKSILSKAVSTYQFVEHRIDVGLAYHVR